MDSLSQLLLGAAIAEVTVGKKIGRSALVIGAALGTLPDLDVLVHYPDAVASFTYHRGWSHSIFTLLLLSLPLAWLFNRIYLNKGPENRIPPSFRQWLLCTGLVLVTHPLLDSFTLYGTQLLWPLPANPIAWGSVFIIDPLYTTPILIACIIAWRHRQHALKATASALILSTAYIGVSLLSQHHARTIAVKSLADQSIVNEKVLIAPLPFSVMWRILSMDDDEYYEGFYSLFDKHRDITFYKFPSNRNLIESNDTRWPVARLDWFTQGFISAQTSNNRLIINDLRMGMESSYIFRFDVGPLNKNNSNDLSQLLPVNINIHRTKALFKRVLHEQVALPIDE